MGSQWEPSPIWGQLGRPIPCLSHRQGPGTPYYACLCSAVPLGAEILEGKGLPCLETSP